MVAALASAPPAGSTISAAAEVAALTGIYVLASGGVGALVPGPLSVPGGSVVGALAPAKL
jgi:hypothetical protein